MIFNKLRRRQSSSLPLRMSHPPTSYVHHASTPPEWPTTPTQATPDVYITSPPEEDGLQTSVCVHRAVEHEPKKLRKQEDRRASVPIDIDASELEAGQQSPPAFRRSSLPTPDLVMPKKPSEFGSTKWTQLLNRQSVTDKGAQERVESSAAASGVEPPATGHIQWEGGHQLTRVSSSREMAAEPTTVLAAPKQKDTLRRRASKVFKSLTNRESITFGSSSADKAESRANGSQQKRRNTLSDGSRPFSIWTRTATAHAVPTATVDDSAASPPKTSGEGRRRSSTIARVEGITRSTTPPLPLPVRQEAAANAPSVLPASRSATNEGVLPLEPPLEISEPASKPNSDASKPRKLQNKRSKATFSHLFGLKGEKQFRSPPPAKREEAPVPPVPVIPQELAKAVADPDTPEVSQTPTFATPGTAATPKSSKSRRFLRHRRRATISSISTPSGTPSSLATPDTPKTPTSLRSRPFSIIDLRKGFNMRSLGKSKGKLMSAKSSPVTPPPVPKLPKDERSEAPTTVMQRYKMSRPPPLQPSDSPPQSEDPPVPASASTVIVSPMTVEFNEVAEALETAMSSPTESEGPATPMFGTRGGSASALAPAVVFSGPKQLEEAAPELSFTPPTSEE
ncbi:hypothetical protein FRC07_012745, partial [Ceratobasidium sp. 392]